MRRRRQPVQQVRKHFDARCFFCGLDLYEILEAHRILPGADDGKYHWANILTCCRNCHGKLTAGLIVVHGAHPATYAARVISVMDEHGREFWRADHEPPPPDPANTEEDDGGLSHPCAA